MARDFNHSAGGERGTHVGARDTGGSAAKPTAAKRLSAKRKTATAKPTGEARASLYDEVTARIIAELEAGRIPWVQPWGGAACGPALPRNALTGRSYSGVNVLILWGTVIKRGCPQRIFLPNDRAIEPQSREAYARFGLNERQIELVARATPKRHYYLQSARGNRLFELGLGSVALVLCGSSDPESQKTIDRLLAEGDVDDFAKRYLRDCGLDWAAEMVESRRVDVKFGQIGLTA